jgi:hypothetical protein
MFQLLENKMRVPPYKFNPALWFAAMLAAGLLFHIDDLPEDILDKSNQPLFTAEECNMLNAILPWVNSNEFFQAWAEAFDE